MASLPTNAPSSNKTSASPQNRLPASTSPGPTDRGNSAARYASDPLPGDPKSVPPSLQLGVVRTDLPVEERPNEALRLAMVAFPKTGNWVAFYRELFGETGVCRKLFPEPEQMRYFETSEAFEEIHEMIAALRSHDTAKRDSAEPERMITIRIPKSLHDALRIEGEQQNLSINKLCITKLLQRTNPKHVPLQKGRRRGRRPGPQIQVKTKTETTATLKQNESPSGEWTDN